MLKLMMILMPMRKFIDFDMNMDMDTGLEHI
jgi:hypothetical protein